MTADILLVEGPIERMPPQSVEAEQAVLGSLLVSTDAIAKVTGILEPDYFYRKAHQFIYAAILDLFDRNEPIDIVTVSQYLKDEGKLDSVGGRQYLTDLALSVATTANVEYYAHLVNEKALLRNLIKTGTEIVASCYEDSEADEILDKAEHLIFSIAQRRNMQQLIHIRDLVNESFARIEKRYENRDALAGVPSGFYDLDVLTSGFQRSDLIIVAARPSMGKCLAYNSEIVLSDGSISTIEEIYRAQSGSILTLENNYKLNWTKPSAFIDDGMKPVFKVTTRLGRTIETTCTHPFLTIFGWKKLEEIGIGEKIAIPRTIPVQGENIIRECEVKLLAYLIGDGSLTQKHKKVSFTNNNLEIQKDFELAVIAFGGTSISHVNSNNRANSFVVRGDARFITHNRQEFAKRLKKAIVYQFPSARQLALVAGLNPSSITMWTQGKCAPNGLASISRSSKNSISLWLNNIGLLGKDAHSKTIPAIVFTLVKSQLALFLNRLFATDGWATCFSSGQPQIGYATVSEKLARQIQHLLLRFSIIAKLRKRRVKYKGTHRHCWQIDITDIQSIETFIQEIGIFSKETAISKVKDAIAERRKQTNCDLLPMAIWEKLKVAKGNESWNSLAKRSNIKGYTNIHVGKRAPTRTKLLSLAKGLNNNQLVNLAQSDVYWDEIVSIEHLGLKQVYDLTIPETHNFVANDICVHNTALCLNIAQHVALEHKIPVAIFSLEMSKEQLVQRLLCSEAKIDANKMRTGFLQSSDWTNLATAMGRLGEAPIYIDDSGLINALEIRAKARRLKAEMKSLGLIIIDYIQLMQGRKQSDNRVQEVSEISRGLKTLAREIDVPVIALSQLSRAVEGRQNKRPMLSDLRESGCLTGETLVYLPETGTYERIDSLVGKTGFKVLALNTKTWLQELREVTNAFSTGIKTVFKLTTRLNRTIRATGNHKFLTLQGWHRLDELKPNMRIAVPRKLASTSIATMSEEEVALVGYLIGDGCTLARHSIQYTTADYDLALHVSNIAKTIFGNDIAPSIKHERQWYQVYLSSTHHLTHGKRNAVAKWLDQLGIFNLRSYEKYVPKEIFAQPNNKIACFLKHLWATDGTIHISEKHPIPTIYYASSSKRLAQDIQSLLLRLEINANIRRSPQNGKGRDQYHVVLSGKPDVEAFLTTIGVQGNRKQPMLNKVIEHLSTRIHNTNRDIIPLDAWKSLVEPARRVIGLSTREMQKLLGTSYCGSTLYKSAMSRQRAYNVARIVASNELANLAQSDIYWDEIVSIEPDGEEEVYDLTVEGLHNFVANNITVHNSIEQDADIVMFIYRDEYYNPESDRRGEAEIIVAKQRNGPTGTVDLLYQSSITRFLNKAAQGQYGSQV
jgi:replicative DNA helicase